MLKELSLSYPRNDRLFPRIRTRDVLFQASMIIAGQIGHKAGDMALNALAKVMSSTALCVNCPPNPNNTICNCNCSPQHVVLLGDRLKCTDCKHPLPLKGGDQDFTEDEESDHPLDEMIYRDIPLDLN